MNEEKRLRLLTEVTVDNSSRFGHVPSTGLPRDGVLMIDYNPIARLFSARLVSCADGKILEGTIAMSREDLFVKVNNCRQQWVNALVDLHEAGRYPFSDSWNFEDEPKLLESIGPTLALAGRRLYREIFRPFEAPEGLSQIADRLERSSMTFNVYSDEFFAPWGMLYSDLPGKVLLPDGSNWSPDGFWGIKHLIEHNPSKHLGDPVVRPPLTFSLNIDETLEKEWKLDLHSGVLDSFGGSEALVTRRTREELREALCNSESSFREDISYFCCHGETTGKPGDGGYNLEASFYLSERPPQPISVSDIQDWLDDRPLPTNTIIFMNTCEGGQMSTQFYRSFVVEFLRREANCVLGPQIDIPAVFAAEYGAQILRRFLVGDGKTMGQIHHELTGHFLYRHRNPLALTYSLYRGLDTVLIPH